MACTTNAAYIRALELPNPPSRLRNVNVYTMDRFFVFLAEQYREESKVRKHNMMTGVRTGVREGGREGGGKARDDRH